MKHYQTRKDLRVSQRDMSLTKENMEAEELSESQMFWKMPIGYRRTCWNQQPKGHLPGYAKVHQVVRPSRVRQQ